MDTHCTAVGAPVPGASSPRSPWQWSAEQWRVLYRVGTDLSDHIPLSLRLLGSSGSAASQPAVLCKPHSWLCVTAPPLPPSPTLRVPL